MPESVVFEMIRHGNTNAYLSMVAKLKIKPRFWNGDSATEGFTREIAYLDTVHFGTAKWVPGKHSLNWGAGEPARYASLRRKGAA